MKKTVAAAIATVMIFAMAGTVFAAPHRAVRHPVNPHHTVKVPQPVYPLHTASVPHPVNQTRPVSPEVLVIHPEPPQRVVEVPYIIRESDTTAKDRVLAITDCVLAVTDAVREW